MRVNYDSQSILHLVKNLVFHSRMKQIDIRNNFVKDVQDDDLVMLLKNYTNINIADVLIMPVT